MIIDVVEFLLYRERERESFLILNFNCTYLEIKRKRNIIDVAEL